MAFGTRSYLSNNDNQMRFGRMPYFGRVIEIIELCYSGFTVDDMFKCEWLKPLMERLQTLQVIRKHGSLASKAFKLITQRSFAEEIKLTNEAFHHKTSPKIKERS